MTNPDKTRVGGTEDRNQRSKGQEHWNGATEKETLGQMIGVKGRMNEVGRQGTDHCETGHSRRETKSRSCETGDRGQETKYSIKT